jgi:hypothetical protein
MTYTLMMLALTVPPSLAFVIERVLRGREAQARKLAAADSARLDHAEDRLTGLESESAHYNTELKRLAEQVSILTDRYAR